MTFFPMLVVYAVVPALHAALLTLVGVCGVAAARRIDGLAGALIAVGGFGCAFAAVLGFGIAIAQLLLFTVFGMGGMPYGIVTALLQASPLLSGLVQAAFFGALAVGLGRLVFFVAPLRLPDPE